MAFVSANDGCTSGQRATIRLAARALIATLFFAPVSPAWGQSEAPRPDQGQEKGGAQPVNTLTAQDVVKLVQAGLSEDLIIATIQRNGRPFDLSTDEILNLKKAGVSDRILKAMIEPQAHVPSTQGETPALKVPPATGGPSGIPDEVGVYWVGSDGVLHRIEGIAVSNMRTGSTLASGMTLGIKRARINAQLRGTRAQLRVKDRQPQFYFYLPEDASIGDYLLLRLAQRKDVRQIEIGERTLWKVQAGVDHAKEIDFTYNRVKNRLYLLHPNGELDRGEYGFYIASGVELKKATGRIYDFGID